MIGETIAHYRITAKLGEGGMGEVYRAHDTKLDRDVAIKILPVAFAQDADRMARFRREAQVLASLNHPNIAHIYGVEERALIMELVEGETLKGPLPIETALDYARQLAEALEAAHEKGITHRDLKPANIMVTPAGVVKVLDFGLAAVAQDPASGSTDPSNSPTLTMRATQVGMIMGTAAYMSPEQAAGKPVDKRGDIWSFGVVLLELLTGHQLFGEGETISHTLADVLRAPIDFDKLPKETPRTIRDLLRRCLDRDVKNRLRDIGEARLAIHRHFADPHAEAPTVVEMPAPRSKLPWAVATVFALALTVLAYLHFRPTSADDQPYTLKFSVLLPDKAAIGGGTIAAGALPQISPDGRRLVIPLSVDGKSGLWVRDLAALTGRLLPGTDGAEFPFWSSDSRFVGFFAGGKLKKIDVTGGPALTLTDASQARGGAWNQNDVILFAPRAAPGATLVRVPAEGGAATLVGVPDSTAYPRAPWFLPDGRHFLFTLRSNSGGEKNSIWLGDLEAKDIPKTGRKLIQADSNAVYTAGYVLFTRERTLMAQPFDVSSLKITGDAFPIAEDVDYLPGNSQSQFSASRNGALAYTSGASPSAGTNVQLTWFDRSGKAAGTVGPPGNVAWPAISPDGNTIAFERGDAQSGSADVWLHDLVRGGQSRLTFGPAQSRFPSWSHDGSHVVYMRAGGTIFQRATNGVGQEEVLDSTPTFKRPSDWSHDGRYIIEDVFTGKGGSEIWVLPVASEKPSEKPANKKPFPFVQSGFLVGLGRVSPNGQWLAYVSEEAKRAEVYVQTFPKPGGKWQVSTNGATQPVWSRDGKELYFLGLDGKMMAVEIRTGKPTFETGVPKALFDTHLRGNMFPNTRFDIGKDGRFLIPVPLDAGAVGSVPITVVVNWRAGLKK